MAHQEQQSTTTTAELMQEPERAMALKEEVERAGDEQYELMLIRQHKTEDEWRRNFCIGEVLGKGANGVVYAATNELSGEAVALRCWARRPRSRAG